MTSAARLPLIALLGLLAAAALLLAGPAASSASAACKNASSPAYKVSNKAARKATLCLINNERTSRGLKKVKQHKSQLKAAKKHTKLMIKKGCFAHLCPGEADLVQRIESAKYLPCNCNWGVGENIAYGHGPQSTPKSIVKAWMKSSGHRKNILDKSFEHIGIGIKSGSPSGGSDAATYTTTFGYRD